MDISVEIAKHDKLHVTISISKKFCKMTMGFEKRNENVFCDRYRRHATFRGLCVFFFFFARSDSSKRKVGAIRTQERMFQCFQAAQDNFQIRPTYWDEFSFLFFRRCISFLCQNWGARRLALRLAEDLRVLEVTF